MPEKGKVCEVDKSPYSNVTWTDVIEKALGNATAIPKTNSADSFPVVGRRWLV